MELMPGTAVDRYVLEEQLGRGGMATVWRVRHRLLGVRRALKVLHRGDAHTEGRALLEGRVQAAMDHPGVLPVLDVLDVGGRVGLVLPLVEGPSLHDLLGAHAPTPAEARALLLAIVRGVAHAHRHGLVHRDLKPGNVLLDLGQGRVRPRVADFGLVKDVTPSDDTLTREGTAIGTPGYAAPEQLSDAARADARSDLFSLGVLWVELRTGQRPWPGRNLLDVVEAWQHPPRLDGMEPAEQALARDLLSRDPSARLPDCGALLARLEALPPGEPAPLGGDGALFRVAWRLRSRRPAPPPAGGRAGNVPPTLAPDDAAGPPTQPPTLASTLATAPPGPRHNLAPARDRFVGRADEVAALVAQVEGGARLVTVLGMGGAGKSRLALEAAWRLVESGARSAGQVDLSEARDAAGVARAVARALDVPLDGDVGRLPEALRGRGPLLLLLDSFEQAAAAAPQTVGPWLDAAPELQVVATSRAPLRLRGEQLLPLGPLDEAAAVELFCDRARAAGATVEAGPAVGRVVGLLDHLPLGVELAAARARTLPPDRLAARLEGRLDGLRSRSADLPARHRTLMATIQWSWDLLAPWEQAALAQLSVFEGGFDVDAVDAVLDLSAWPAAPWPEDALAELVDKSLVRAGTSARTGAPRFSLLRVVQQFASDRLDEGGRAAAEARFVDHFAEAGRPERRAALHRRGGTARARALADDLDNLMAAARRGAGDAAAWAGLAAAQVLHRTGPLDAALGVLAAVRAGAGPTARADLDAQVGELASLAGRQEAAGEALQRAIAAYRALGQAGGEARATALLANHHLRRRELDAAGTGYDAALALADAAGDDRARALALSNRGILHHWRGALDAAQRDLRDALDLHRRLGDARFEAIVLLNLGNLAGDRGRFAESRRHLEAALAGHREAGNRLAEAATLGTLGRIDLVQGRLPSARSRAERALGLQRRSGVLRSEGVLLGLLADIHAASGRSVSAVALAEQALARHEAAGDQRWQGLQALALGRFALDRGAGAEAAARLARARAALAAASPADLALVSAQEARLAWLQGDPEAAWAAVADTDLAAAQPGEHLRRAEVLLSVAEIAGGTDRAEAHAAAVAALGRLLPGLGLTPEAALARRARAAGVPSERVSPGG